MNFRLTDTLFLRKIDNHLCLVEVSDSNENILARLDESTFASVISSYSPFKEQHGSYDYALDFIQGIMYCGGCGKRLLASDVSKIVGKLSVINITACEDCYTNKFGPLFNWALSSMSKVKPPVR